MIGISIVTVLYWKQELYDYSCFQYKTVTMLVPITLDSLLQCVIYHCHFGQVLVFFDHSCTRCALDCLKILPQKIMENDKFILEMSGKSHRTYMAKLPWITLTQWINGWARARLPQRLKSWIDCMLWALLSCPFYVEALKHIPSILFPGSIWSEKKVICMYTSWTII